MSEDSPPVVVIGASPTERIPAIVCEFTIKKFCPEAEVVQIFDRGDRPTRGLIDHGGKDPTSFSFVRFWLPELRERKGRAIYLDSDMIVLSDISELFELPMGNNWILRHADPSVLLVDCAKTPWKVSDMISRVDRGGPEAYRVNMMTIGGVPRGVVGRIPDEWNHRDRFVYDEDLGIAQRQHEATRILHYTNMESQPWPNHRHPETIPEHPLGFLWYDALVGTIDSGMLDEEDLPPVMVTHLEQARCDAPEAVEGITEPRGQ